jgi:hypothetical protein
MLSRRLSYLFLPFISTIGMMPSISSANTVEKALNNSDSSTVATTYSQQSERKYGLPKKRTRHTTFDSNYSSIGHQIIDAGASVINTNETKTLINTINTIFGVKDNLSVSFTLPLVTKTSESNGNKKNSTAIGDISGGIVFQPFPSSNDGTTFIINANANLPTGTSPYDGLQSIVSTGLGSPSGSVSFNLYKKSSGISLFGSAGVTLTLPINNVDKFVPDTNIKLTKVDPGNIYNICIGATSRINDRAFGTLSLQYTYIEKNKFSYVDVTTNETSGRESSSKDIGSVNFGIRTLINQKIDTDFRIGIGLTPDSPSINAGVSFPLNI